MSAGAKQFTSISNDQNLMVCLRIRPMNESEIHMGIPMIAHSLDGNVVVLLDPLEDPDDILRANRSREKQFVFDNVFNSSCTQEEVFQMSTLPLITQVLEGYTATVFAYGATGTGKTHTMLGSYEHPGIMIQALHSLFSKMRDLMENLQFQVIISYLEVYNETIKDLLSPTSPILDLREDQYGGVQVAGLSEVEVTTTEEVMDILSDGNSRRSVEATAANKHSSRSHAVLQVSVISRPRVRTDYQEQIFRGRLYLIDLAGSERASNTLNRGKRMTEGAHINRSLLALGNCINALADPNTKRYVNFRDSKLTRLLKDALSGNCRTVMVAHISPTSPHFEDSRNTLVYADRAKHIRTKVHRNMHDINYHLVQYNSIIAELKLEINRLRNKLENMNSPSDQDETTGVVSMNDQVEEMKLKDQLLITFQKHANCKKALSDNLTNDMDLSLEETRCQVIIKEWELKKSRRIPNREIKDEDPDIQNEEKSLELAGLEFISEPDNIRSSRNELKLVQIDRQKLQQQRQKLESELDMHTASIKQLEKTIPERVRNARIRQTLELLCRLHKLEIQQNDLRTDNAILRQHSTRHELIQAALLRHCELCTQIIQAQSEIIAQHPDTITVPKSLEMMLQLYDQDDPSVIVNLSKDLVDTDKISFNYGKLDLQTDNHVDSNSDIRELTSNMSIIEANPEEKNSTASFPVVPNQRSTPDTWDNDSLLHTKPITTRLQEEKKNILEYSKQSKFNNNIPEMKISTNASNRNLKRTSMFPGIRGKQIAETPSNRSRSIEPNKGSNQKNTRRITGPRLDIFGNVLFDIDVRNPYINSQRKGYHRKSQNPAFSNNIVNSYRGYPQNHQQKFNSNVSKRTDMIGVKEERYVNPKQYRAAEIKKLNERKPSEITKATFNDYDDNNNTNNNINNKTTSDSQITF